MRQADYPMLTQFCSSKSQHTNDSGDQSRYVTADCVFTKPIGS